MKKDVLDEWLDDHVDIIGLPKKSVKDIKKYLKEGLIESEGNNE